MAVNGPSHLTGGDERSFAKDAREKRVASTPGKDRGMRRRPHRRIEDFTV